MGAGPPSDSGVQGLLSSAAVQAGEGTPGQSDGGEDHCWFRDSRKLWAAVLSPSGSRWVEMARKRSGSNQTVYRAFWAEVLTPKFTCYKPHPSTSACSGLWRKDPPGWNHG